MNHRALHKKKIDTKDLLCKSLQIHGLGEMLKPYLKGGAVALEDICQTIAQKQTGFTREETVLLLLQEYLRRAK